MVKRETRNKTDMLNGYFLWLSRKLRVNQKTRSYFLLIKHLYMREFKYSISNDSNRVTDGIGLREKYCDEENIEYAPHYFEEWASVLEVILALAIRMEFQMADTDYSEKAWFWFWKILGNLGLDQFDDENYYNVTADMKTGYQITGPEKVDLTINRLIERTYRPDGSGGLFPIKCREEDQRTVEIWYQMNWYLTENFY